MAVKVITKTVGGTKVALASPGVNGVTVAFVSIANSALWIGGSDLALDGDGNVVNGVNVPSGTLEMQLRLLSGDTLYGIVPTGAGGPFDYRFLTYEGSLL